ncbi:MAG TPA: NAD-dependent epimerase/dehydratase family protein [Chloroflexia bacterium]|nr:NAD-dependent epimerase/dehydratase family protein [Chloroflexia bacterium]
MKVFVTGGTGFIGRRVVRRLIDRGDQVWALARSDNSAAALAVAGARVVRGDITDPASFREGMRGSDLVFHLAAWYRMDLQDWHTAEQINVGGTRQVLGLAQELGVPKIVYTSSAAVFGNTHGRVVNERYVYTGPFSSAYASSKWTAHYKVVLPLIYWKGAPIVIVLPGTVYGPGDPRLLGTLMRRYYQRAFRLVPGPETTLTYAHVDDIAAGHLLAADQGARGESYILAGPALPLGQLVGLWADLLGRRPPSVRIPTRVLRALAPALGLAAPLLARSPLFNREMLAHLGTTELVRADKAATELGWQARPLREGLAETFAWIAAQTPPGR